MSDSTATKKRKSEASSSGSKKARTTKANASAQTLVAAILADSKAYPVSDDATVVRNSLVELAQYARALEQEVASGSGKPAPKTKEQIEAAAEKLRNAARSGIRKQMTVSHSLMNLPGLFELIPCIPANSQWKQTCKTGSAKWTYDGVCSDPDVFGALLELDGPPKFKLKKMKKDEFVDLIGDLDVPIR